jgi:hypothetical protein
MDEYVGRQVVGIDLHRRRSVIVRMTEAGERLGVVRIDNDPVALGLEIAKAGTSPEVVLEATYGWYWAADVLAEAGARVHLAHPLGVRSFAHRRVKNDLLTEPQHVAAGHRPAALRQPARHGGLSTVNVRFRAVTSTLGSTESGHTVLNGIPNFSSLPLFDISSSRP